MRRFTTPQLCQGFFSGVWTNVRICALNCGTYRPSRAFIPAIKVFSLRLCRPVVKNNNWKLKPWLVVCETYVHGTKSPFVVAHTRETNPRTRTCVKSCKAAVNLETNEQSWVESVCVCMCVCVLCVRGLRFQQMKSDTVESANTIFLWENLIRCVTLVQQLQVLDWVRSRDNQSLFLCSSSSDQASQCPSVVQAKSIRLLACFSAMSVANFTAWNLGRTQRPTGKFQQGFCKANSTGSFRL